MNQQEYATEENRKGMSYYAEIPCDSIEINEDA